MKKFNLELKPPMYITIYVALIQSSGYEKSRAVGELSKLNYWILLLCFRSNESSYFPPKTPKSNNSFLKELYKCESADDAEKMALLLISVSVQIIIRIYKGNELCYFLD